MKSFLLVGIGGVYNYGCEAIVRGTELILRERWPDARIVYASWRPEDDQRRLVGARIDIVGRKPISRYSSVNIARKALACAGIRWIPADPRPGLLKGMDAVLSIGGDIYTLGNDGSFPQALPTFGDAAVRRGVPYVLWGASVGPFTPNPVAENFFRKHFSRVSLVTAREQNTVEYLSGFAPLTRVVRCADPAFAVAPEAVEATATENREVTIGINLSPLSLRYLGLTNEQSAEMHGKMVGTIVNRFSAKVLLIPHVVCDFHEDDDDLRYLQRVHRNVDKGCRDRVNLLDTDPGFTGVQKILKQCDLVVAARMHCGINAMESHVPALLLAYSEKAKGMCDYVYGHRKWVLPLTDFCSDECLKTVEEMLENRVAISEGLKDRMHDVQSDVRRPLQALETLLG